MIYLFVGLGLFFVLIGFSLTEKNAPYLLSGYNTMSENDRKQVDLAAYIPFFRRFHLFLGMSVMIVGITLTSIINQNAGGIFLGVYPILAYIYFIAAASKFSKGTFATQSKAGAGILVITLFLVIGLFGYGFMENELTADASGITISGMYGEVITPSDLQRVELIQELPEIRLKTNGFALGTRNKGYFMTENGERVKLLVNSAQAPVILLTKTNGFKIYYSAYTQSNEAIIQAIKNTLPAMPDHP